MNCCDSPRKFLIATWEGGGSVGPKLTVARKLREAGHDVRVMSDECNRLEAETIGIRFVSWTRAPNRKDRNRESELVRDWAEASPAEGFMQAIDTVFAGPALAYARDIMEELERESVDLVVSSELLFGVMAGCEAAKQDFALLPCNWLFYPLEGAPRSFPAHREPLGDSDRATLEEMRAGMKALFDHGLPALNTARATLGLPVLTTVLEQVEAARMILIGISREFDFAPDADPPGFRYVGPQIDDPAWAGRWNSPFPAEDTRPLVLASFSTTFQNQVASLQRTIDALSLLPVRAVVTLGPAIRPEELMPAANVKLLRGAPHNAVMKEARLVVTHGGHGTLARAMVNRLPVLVMPHGRDQDGNAARIAEHGAGLVVPNDAGTAEIAAAAARLLEEPRFAASARRLGEAVAREMAESPVVEELEALCCRQYA